MSRPPVLLLVLVLVLALPLRAVGAVTMLGCAGHGGMAPVTVGHDPAAHAPVLHHGHDGAAHAHSSLFHQGAHGGAPGGAGCQVCGDCCLSVNAMPVTPPLTGMPGQALLPVFVLQPYTGFHPEGPERPPRHAVAL